MQIDFLESNNIVESIWPWLAHNGDPICSYSSNVPEYRKDVRLILKDNWSVLGFKNWTELVDKDKLVKIDFTQFSEMCHYSELTSEEINWIKDIRRKAQKCRSSLKSQAKVKVSEMNLEIKVNLLSDEKMNLQHEMVDLSNEISIYKKQLSLN